MKRGMVDKQGESMVASYRYPLLSMNKAWMYECAARIQPLVDQYKPRQHLTLAKEKFCDLIETTRSCSEKEFLHLK